MGSLTADQSASGMFLVDLNQWTTLPTPAFEMSPAPLHNQSLSNQSNQPQKNARRFVTKTLQIYAALRLTRNRTKGT